MSATVATRSHWATYKRILGELMSLPADMQDVVPDKSKLIYLEAQERVIPGWDKAATLARLGVTEVPYSLDTATGVHGWSNDKELAITRATGYPSAVVWHELGHILMEHSKLGDAYGNDPYVRAGAECTAELIAYLCCYAFEYNEAKSKSRAYVKHWGRSPNTLKELNYGRIYEAVDKIRGI